MKSIDKLKEFMSEEDTKKIAKLIDNNNPHYDKHVKISIASTLITYNIPQLINEDDVIYVIDAKKNKYIIPAKYSKYIHECGLYKSYVADNLPILFNVVFEKDSDIASIYYIIEDNHKEEILLNDYALKTLNGLKQEEMIDLIRNNSSKNKKKEDKIKMAKNKEIWIPTLNPDQNPNFLYPLSAYKTLRNRIKDEFYKNKYLLVDLEDENKFYTDGENNNIRFIKVNTTEENKNIIIPIYKECEPLISHIKTSDQSYKKIELKIFNKEINYSGLITVIYSLDEVYMSVSDAHMISMLQPNDIKNLIIEATTIQASKNKSRQRVNKKKH